MSAPKCPPASTADSIQTTPISKRKIDDTQSPISTDNDSIIFSLTSQNSPDRKIRLVEENQSDLETKTDDITADEGTPLGITNSVTGEHKTRRSKRIQPARVKKIYKAKRLIVTQNKRDKKSKTSSSTQIPPQNIDDSKIQPPTTNSLTLQDLEKCMEKGFEKLKKEFPNREEVDNSLDRLSCMLKNDVATVYEQVQSNAISINDQSEEMHTLKEDLTTLSSKFSLSEEEKKSDYQFVTNKLNKLTATVTNVKKTVDRPNASMQTVKLTETSEKLQSEVTILQSKYDEAKHEIAKLNEKLENIKLKVNELQVTDAAQTPLFRAPNQEQVHEEALRNKCIIIEGVTEDSDANLYDIAVEMMDEMGITLHYWEINYIERVGRFNPNRNWPRPIRLSLISDWKRDLLIERRDNLFYTPHYFNVSFKPDEPKHLRVAKAKLRQAVNKARLQGAMIRNRESGIYINGIKYTTDNVDDIPERFIDIHRKNRPCSKITNNASTSQSNTNSNLNTNNHRHESMDTTPHLEELNGDWIEPGIRKVKGGLAFFTFRAFMSNFHSAPFTLNNEDHKTGEHGLQMEKAWFHRDHNAVTAIRQASTPAEAKAAGGAIKTLPEWNERKYSISDKVLYARYTQNPELAERLCATGNCRLIEASLDTDWGIGISIWDNKIAEGIGHGNNNLGKSTERVRARLQKEKSEGTGIWAPKTT